MASELIQDKLNPGDANDFSDYLVPPSADSQRKSSIENKGEGFSDYLVPPNGGNRLEATINSYDSRNTNPDRSAEALTLSKKTGLPHDTVERNFDDVNANVKSSDNNTIIEQSKVLQNYLVKPGSAKISSDDISTLDKVTKSIEDIGSWMATPTSKSFDAMTVKEQRKAISEQLSGGADPLEHLRVATASAVRTVFGTGLVGTGELLESSARQLDNLLTGGANPKPEEGTLEYYLTPSTWLQEAGKGGKLVADFIDIPKDKVTFGTKVTGAVGQIISQAVLTMVNPEIGMTVLFSMGVEQQSDDPDNALDSDNTRDMKIILGAIGTGVSEKLSLDFLMRKLPPEARGGVVKFIKDKALSGGAEAVQEVVENMWHDLVKIIGHDIDPDADIFNWDKLWESARVAFSGAATFRTMFEVLLPGKARGGHTVAAEARVEKYKQLKDTVLESKTFDRHKGKFEEFVDTSLEDATDPNVYFDAEQVNTFFQSREESPEEVLSQLGVDADTWGQAVSSGGDVKVPLSKFLTLADTEYYDPMLQDIRTEQGDETLREAIQVSEARIKDIFSEADRILAKNENAEAIKASGQEVRALVRDQLVATGKFDVDTSDKYAALHEAFAITLSSKLGVTPMEAYKKASGLRVQAGVTKQTLDQLEDTLIGEVKTFSKALNKQSEIEQLIRDVTVRPVIDANNPDVFLNVETVIKHDRKDVAEYIVARAERYAESMGTEPGVSKESPKYEEIKKDLINRKNQAVKNAQKLRERINKADIIEDVMFKQEKIDKPAILEEILVEEGITDDEFQKHFSTTYDVRDSKREAVFTTHSGRKVEQGFSDNTTAKTTEGVLLKLFHGSFRGMRSEKFTFEALGKASTHPTSGLGVFSTTDKSHAESYGDVVDTFHVDMRNPKVFKVDELPQYDTVKEYFDYRESLRDEGHDGIVLDYRSIGGGIQFVLFDYDQVVNEKPTETFYQVKERAQRDHMNLWSAVEQAVLDMPLPAWKAKPKKVLTDIERERLTWFKDKPFPTSTASPEYQELKSLLDKQDAELPAANGSDILAKMKNTQGIKKEELEWLGIEDYLKSKKKFTRDEVASFVRDNGVEVVEVVAEGEASEAAFDWKEEIDDDESNWESRVEDYMSEFDDSSIATDFYFFEFNNWYNDNIQTVINNYEPSLPEDTKQEVEEAASGDVSDVIYVLESAGYDVHEDMKSEMRDKFEEAATEAAKSEYFESPYVTYTDEATGYRINGNDDIGYGLDVGRGFGQGAARHFSDVYSFSEAEIQATSIAYEQDAFKDEDDVETPRWSEYVVADEAENYRELKLTLPEIQGKGSETTYYNDVHFPDANLVTFLRLSDRTLSTGLPPIVTPEKEVNFKVEVIDNPITDAIVKRVMVATETESGKEIYTLGLKSNTNEQNAVGKLSDKLKTPGSRFRHHNVTTEGKLVVTKTTEDIGDVNSYFIEEFQSDWHQQGRQVGYQLGGDAGELDAQATEIRNEFIDDIVTESFNKFNVEDLSELGFTNVTDNRYEVIINILENNGKLPDKMEGVADGRSVPYDNMLAVITESDNFSKYLSAFKEYDRLQDRAQVEREGVLDAPFKGDGWISLGLKRAIVDAVEQGYKSVSWVDSTVLVNRWSNNYKTLYETQYDKKMTSIVKKLTKIKPVHLTFAGEVISGDYKISEFEVRSVGDESATRFVIYRNGERFADNTYVNEISAEDQIADIVRYGIDEEGYWTIPITDELRESVKQDGFALFQKKEAQTPAGQIQFPTDGEAVMTLFELADMSTFLHESGHFFLQAYRELAKTNVEIHRDLKVLTDWMGVDDASEIGIEEHEMFARGFEAYLIEGKAPNTKLQAIFDSFRSWLINVYKNIRNLNVNLTDEVRGVMDRMLATDEAISEAEQVNNLLPVYDSAESAGMSEKEYADYTKAYERATMAAQSDTDAELQARLRREQKEAWKEERNKIRDDVLEELYSIPAYQARWFFMRGTLPNGESIPGIKPTKLSRSALIEMYGDDLKALWRKLPFGKYSVWTKNDDGVHPDEIAPVFGFTNGNEMIQAMVATKGNIKNIATEEADLIMRKKYGDPDSQQAIAELAMETVQNQERSNFLSVELRALEKRAGTEKTPRNVIKRAAIRIINGTRISEIKEQSYLRTANKWARRALEFATQDKFEEAADAKRKQLLNQAIYQEAIKARKYVETKTRYLKKFDSPGVRKNLARDYLDQIDSVLEAYDLKKTTTLKEVERRKSLNEWITSQVEQGLEVIIPPDLIERARKRSYKDLPYEEFTGLVDSVKNIEHIAKFKQKLIVNKQKRDFNETIDDLITTALDNNTWKKQKIGLKTDLDKAKSFSREFLASHVKMEFLMQQLDGNVPNGPWWSSVFKPIAEAEDAEIVMSQEYMTELNTIFEQYGTKGRTGLYKETLNTEATLGRNIKRAELISMALNWGNEGNRKALLRGEDWSQQQIQKVLNEHMTEQDWNTVQQTWALIDTLWPQISALQKELTGVVPAKVEPTQVKTTFGTFTGGYYPLVYDTERSIKAFKYEEKMSVDEMFGGNYTKPSTRQGHTIERVGSDGMAVKLDLDVIGSHLVNVIHDITHRKAVLQADHILQNKQVAEAIIAITDRETYQHIRPWLAGIASDKRPFAGWMEQTVGRLRRGATAVNMGWKVTTAIVQPLGYFQSVELLGEKYALKGLSAFYGNPLKAKNVINEVFSKSTMMANRSKTFDRDVRDAVRRIKGDSLTAKIQRSLFSHIGFMDYSVSIPTWLGAYEKNMDEQRAEGNGINEANAIAYADSVVRMSQSAGGAKDLAAIQRGSELQRAFTMFYSYFSVLHNLIRNRIQTSKKAGFSGANVTRTTMSMMYLVVLPAVLAEIIVGRMPDDDDEENKLAWAAKVSTAYPFMTMVGVRDFANALSSGYTYQATPLLDAADSFLKAGEGVGDAFTDFTGLTDEEFDRKDVKNMAMSAGYLFALPARQLYTTGEHLYSVLEDEEEFSLYEFLYRNKRD